MSYKLGFHCTSCRTKGQLLVSDGMYEKMKLVRCGSCQEINTIKIPPEKVFLAKKRKSFTKKTDDKTFISDPSSTSKRIELVVTDCEFTKAQSFYLIEDRYLVGRKNNGGPNVKPDIEIVSRDGFMSKLHCEIKKVGDDYAISDFSSANGTYVNGEKLTPSDAVFLAVEDVIVLGRTEIKIKQS